MKTEEEIKEKLKQVKRNKSQAKSRYSDVSYIIHSKLEAMLKWVLSTKDEQ